jgi:hypothetical protein
VVESIRFSTTGHPRFAMRPANPIPTGTLKIGSAWKHVCAVIDILILGVFVVEFVLRVVLAKRRIQYAARYGPDVLSGTGGA